MKKTTKPGTDEIDESINIETSHVKINLEQVSWKEIAALSVVLIFILVVLVIYVVFLRGA